MTQDSAHPPKARLVLRVGVTGHRWNKIGEPETDSYKAVEHAVRKALRAIKASLHRIADTEAFKGAYVDRDPLLRIISPLAEGADRIAAEEAMKLGAELQVVLPFAREIYKDDFIDPSSKAAFDRLLGDASAILELDGMRACRSAADEPAADKAAPEKVAADKAAADEAVQDRAYRAAGLMMLRQSDVVIAVWDGKPAESDAGTGAIAAAALATGIPVLWIDPLVPALGARRLTSIKDPICDPAPKVEDPPAKDLDVILTPLLIPAQASGHESGLRKAGREWRAYLGQKWPRWPVFGWAYSLWASLWAWTWLGLGVSLPTRAQREGVPWPVPAARPRDEAALKALEAARDKNKGLYDYVKAHYLWADQLANYYARQFRGAYVFALCLAPSAIVAAVLHCWYCSGAKLVIVAFILALVVVAARYRWHSRWLACRGLAEQLRQLRILAPLGRTPAHDTGPDPGRSWADWHFRAVVREAGLVNVNLDEGLRRGLAEHVVQELVKDQIDYHEVTRNRTRHIAHRLHYLHYILFGLTVLVVVVKVLYPCSIIFGIDGSGWAIIFSAFGGASIGLANQGEFERIAHSSEAMETQLRGILLDFERLPDAPSATELGDRVERAAALMLKEVLGWRSLFLTRPLEPPA